MFSDSASLGMADGVSGSRYLSWSFENKLEDAFGRIEEMSKLMRRAADALEKLNRCFLVEDASVDWELIAQLRDVARVR